MQTTEKTKIKDWYTAAFPTDDLGTELSNATFYDLFEALDNYRDVYELLGVGDSIIRERVFAELAKVMEVNYNYIYEQWMKGV